MTMKDGYHSPYWAEFYDLSYKLFPCLNDDSQIFKDAYKSMRTQRLLNHSSPDQYLVVDIGCGTGRVFCQLAENFIAEGLLYDNTTFLGLDYSTHMLALATTKTPKSIKSCTKYVHGSAMDLQAVEELRGPTKVDLMTFAAASISMLMEPGQAEEFLAQAATVLRPKTGRLFISVRYVFDDARQAEQDQIQADVDEAAISTDTLSVLYPGIIYRQVDQNYRRQGNLAFWDLDMQVVDTNGTHGDRVIEEDRASIGGRVWQDGELLLAATGAGLALDHTLSTSNETMYVFRRD